MLSIIGTIIGLLGSFIPKVLDYLKVKEDHKHELEVLKVQAEIAKAEHTYRLEEIAAQADIVSEQAVYKQAEIKYTGVKVFDGILALYSGTVRPTLTYLFMGLYMFVKYSQLRVLMAQNVGQPLVDLVWQLWNSEDMAAFMTIIGFWFGGRLLKHTMATFDVGDNGPRRQLSPPITTTQPPKPSTTSNVNSDYAQDIGHRY